MPVVFSLISLYFLVGGFSIWRISRRKTREETAALWLKYAVYLFLVAIILTILYLWAQAMFWAGLFIALGGLVEIGTHALKAPAKRWPALLIYIPLALLFVLFCLNAPLSPVVLYTYVLVLTFDGFSQVAGQLFGRKKLIPRISPHKTLAGLAGGSLMAILTSFLIQPFTLYNFLYTVIVLIFAFGGDAAASALKRLWGIKDYSRAIPGHGGFLDRFDSLMGAGAVLQLLIMYLPDNKLQEIITF
jgi:phosphatidate cytidylyltransferase